MKKTFTALMLLTLSFTSLAASSQTKTFSCEPNNPSVSVKSIKIIASTEVSSGTLEVTQEDGSIFEEKFIYTLYKNEHLIEGSKYKIYMNKYGRDWGGVVWDHGIDYSSVLSCKKTH